nr:sulfurtransferase TusA family protein [Tamilnaduibacter salinus]
MTIPTSCSSVTSNAIGSIVTDQTLDASGLTCPMPLLKTKLQLQSMSAGERLIVIATDPGSARDIPEWLAQSPHRLDDSEVSESHYRFVISCRAAELDSDGGE